MGPLPCSFRSLEQAGRVRRPIIPNGCVHNAHMYYLLLKDLDDRTKFIDDLKSQGVHCVFHYVPLHNSPYGLKVARTHGDLVVTEELADRLVRLPLWVDLEEMQEWVITNINLNVN